MHTEKTANPALAEEQELTGEEQQDNSLSWLLDQELTDAGDSLFSVTHEETDDLELTEAEAMMAARPLVRGSNDTEVLSAFVEEEIVVGSVGDSSDIYSGVAAAEEAEHAESAPDQMIVDHGTQRKAESNGQGSRKIAGDILGLRDDDDMGERHLVIKKAQTEGEPTTAVPTAEMTAPHQDDTSTLAPETSSALPEEMDTVLHQVGDQSDSPLGEISEPLDLSEEIITLNAPEEESESHDETLAIDELMEEDGQPADDYAQIDYHADFQASREDAASIVTRVTPLLGDVVDALQAQIDQRAEDLAVTDQDSLELSCTLATDPSTCEQSTKDGFIELNAFTSSPPECLADLDEDSLAAIRVRLLHRESGSNWNRLLQDDFEIPVAIETTPELPPIEFQSVTSANDEIAGLPDELLSPEQPPSDGVFTDEEVQLLGGSADETDALLPVDSAQQSADRAGAVSDAAEGTAETVVDFAAIAGKEENVPESPFGNLDDEDWSLADAAASSAVDGDSDIMGFDEFIGTAANSVSADVEAANSDEPSLAGELPVFDLLDSADEPAGQEGPGSMGDQELLSTTEKNIDGADEPEAFDDIFGEDLDADLGIEACAVDSDVDALLDSLDIGEEPGDVDLVSAIAMVENDAMAQPVDEDSQAQQASPIQEEEAREPSVDADVAFAEAAVQAGPWCIPQSIEFSYTSASSAELFSDFLDAFIEEGAVEVEKLEDAVSLWEQDIDSEDAYAPVTRILHTLKGIAKGVGLQRYGTLIHNFETLLEKLERPAQSESAQYFRIVNAWLDATVRGFEKIQDDRADVASEFPLVEGGQPEAGPELESSKQSTEEQKAAEKTDDKKVADEGAKALAAQQTIRLSVDAVDHLMNLTNQAQQLGVRSSQGSVRGKMALAELQGRLSSVRSHIARIADRALMNVTARGGAPSAELDALEMDQYSELQEAANILREGVEDLSELIQMTSRQNALVEALLKQQNSVMSSLRSAIQSARVIPVSRLMPGLRRIVRTVGADLGKDVAFRVVNETGKLDRDNFSRCQVVLEHMVRNALDHGIEDADTRKAAGKPQTGKIAVDVGKEGGDYVIRLSDDGKGMNPDVIREAAYRKGLDVDLQNMSDAEVLRLVFHKGFSTAASVSEVSGRGVGMDIVLSELQAIGGSIDIESTVGEGTTFIIRIPSNVTANGALLVSAGEHSYAVPLDGLVAVEHIPVDAFFEAIGNNETLELFSLHCEPAYLATLCHGEKMPDRNAWSSTIPVIVAGDGEHYMAIAIDDVEQALELVIRTLGSQFGNVPGLAGGATTADGRAIVALDLNALVGNLAARGADRVAMADDPQDDMLVMVVDDSRTQRLVATSKFDSLGVETITAENGMAAIDLLNASHRLPDVILLDVEMPVKDGIQTLKELRKSPRYGDIPVIMVTSRTGAKHRKMAAEAGCNGYMGKPFNFPLLVQDINKLTGRQLTLG